MADVKRGTNLHCTESLEIERLFIDKNQLKTNIDEESDYIIHEKKILIEIKNYNFLPVLY